MSLFGIPSPVDMVESAINGKLEREVINAALSAAFSSYISGLWRSGSAKWADWSGEGQAMKDMATATYLSLREVETKGFLTLTLPKDLLDPDNLSRFQTEKIAT